MSLLERDPSGQNFGINLTQYSIPVFEVNETTPRVVVKHHFLSDAEKVLSIHFHGPGRAAGVPIIAGLIMYDEVAAGEIAHKVACATHFNAYGEFTFPAVWTDGHYPGGIPEGAVIQLDPSLDLSRFDLLPGERVVARAL